MTTFTLPPGTNPFDVLASDDAKALRRLGDVVTVPPGTTIHPRGATSRWLYVVVDGMVAVGDGGPPETAGPGAGFPQEALRGELVPTRSSAVAITEVTVLALGLREFHGALDTIPAFADVMRTVTRGAQAPALRTSRHDGGGAET